MKALFHIGTPRTGTTSLQHSFRDNQGLLHSLGYHYPSNVVSDRHPSHANLMRALYEGNLGYCDRFMHQAYLESEDKVALISCEGVYFMWHRFPAKSKDWVEAQAKQLGWQAVVVFRDKEDFTKSLYDHCRTQEPVPEIPELGTKLGYGEFYSLPYVQKLADYQTMTLELTLAFNGQLTVMGYRTDMVKAFYADMLVYRGSLAEYRLNETSDQGVYNV